MTEHLILLKSAAETQQFTSRLAKLIPSGVVYLIGDLGAGKTTFARFWLESLGVTARIKSPTYTLVEEYQLKATTVYHLDLYRLELGEDYLDLGLDDLPEGALMLIEWPDKAAGYVPKPDLTIRLDFLPEAGEQARMLSIDGPLAALINPDDC